jgi:hypothetical protein
MKKSWLFIFSLFMAMTITFYTKKEAENSFSKNETKWKTYIKAASSEITGHHTTAEEYEAARIPEERVSATTRTPANTPPQKKFRMRNNRVLMGEANPKYEDVNEDLEMINSVSPTWKDDMGVELMRFQDTETKLLVKEEKPIIKVQNGKGRFLEEVIITYLMKNGNQSSFKALVDSETGSLVETWDRTIHEKVRKKREGIRLPSSEESGIIVR